MENWAQNTGSGALAVIAFSRQPDGITYGQTCPIDRSGVHVRSFLSPRLGAKRIGAFDRHAGQLSFLCAAAFRIAL